MHYFSNLKYFYIHFLYICTIVFVSGLTGAHSLHEWQLNFFLLRKIISKTNLWLSKGRVSAGTKEQIKCIGLIYTNYYLKCVSNKNILYVCPSSCSNLDWSIKVKESENHSVMSDSLRPYGLYSPCNSPGQDTVGSLSLLQGIFPNQVLNKVSCSAGRFFSSWATREAHSGV